MHSEQPHSCSGRCRNNRRTTAACLHGRTTTSVDGNRCRRHLAPVGVYGTTRFTPAVIGALLIPVVLHSVNDSSTYLACGAPGGQSVRAALCAGDPTLCRTCFQVLRESINRIRHHGVSQQGLASGQTEVAAYRTEDVEKDTTRSLTPRRAF